LVGFLTAAAPYLGLWVAESPSVGRIGLGFIYFMLHGIATYTAGTVFLSLITDLTSDEARGRAVAIIWTLLMVGILVGVFVGVTMLRAYSFHRLVETFVLVTGLVWLLVGVALWRQERPASQVKKTAQPLGEALRRLWSSRQTRLFFSLLVVSLFAYFVQDVVLEPFGGHVFGLSVSETTRFNAYMMVGVIGGILLGGFRFARSWGNKRVAFIGAVLQGISFAMLASISIWRVESLIAVAILITGFGMGIFTAGSVSMMMEMTLSGQAGLFAGAWTLATAAAKFPASISGGLIHQLVFDFTQRHDLAYGAVFAVEAIGFVLVIYLLNKVAVEEFRHEAGLPAILAAID
jgi:BCD family chlorophyll transporter-like MFS transporter